MIRRFVAVAAGLMISSSALISVPNAAAQAGSPPIAAFTFTPPVPSPGQAVTFDASTSTDPEGPIADVDYDWDLDNDGAFDDAEGQVIAHPFAAAGSYSVTLRVTDSDSNVDTETQIVRVNAAPEAAFIFEPSTPAVNEQITFSSLSVDDNPFPGGSHRWDFDDDGQFDDAVGTSATHAFAAPGTYSVALQVTDSDGIVDIASREVVVQANPPVAAFTFAPAAPQTLETVAFDASTSTPPNGESIVTIDWDLDGDGDFDDAAGPVASFTYLTPGPRTASVRVLSSGGGVDIVRGLVTVSNRAPSAAFTFEPKAPTVGDTLVLTSISTDPDGPITETRWDLDDDGQFDDADSATTEIPAGKEGPRRVALRVVDANGETDIARETIEIGPRQLELLSPFPVVRLAGSIKTNGKTEIDRFTVDAPRGSDVTVRCRGGDCPFHEWAHAVGKKGRLKVVSLQRVLAGGTEIEVFVMKRNAVGKYTQFKLRTDKAPKRTDRCVAGYRLKPVSCPRQ